MKLAYETATMKNATAQLHGPAHTLEYGFPTYTNPNGGVIVGNGPADAPLDKQIQHGPVTGWSPDYRPNATAIFLSHVGSGLPSSPGNSAGEAGQGDTVAAAKSQIDQYVLSYEGLSVARANGPVNPPKGWNPWMVRGTGIDDWLKKLQKQCGPN